MALQLARSPLLRPVAALAGWSFIMEAWMYATRFPAMAQNDVQPNPDTITDELKTKIPAKYRWQAENYNHLHEQPTYFVAVALALAMIGDNHPYTVYAAWGYTGLRILHSLVHATVNKIMVRFQIFATSSVVVAGLTARLAQLVF